MAGRAKRMQVVLDLARRAEDSAANQLRQCQDAIEEARRQQQQMAEYHQEYLQGLNHKTHRLNPSSMINDRQFLQQIQSVMSKQQQQIQQLQNTERQCMEQWQSAWNRRNSIQQLIERLESEENLLVEKKLAKELDEMAAVVFRSRGNENQSY